jgi:6,7-dimethyl-8-ribityllumazine synthase
MKVIEGKLDGKGLKVAIVASRFNDFITSKLIEGARDCLVRHSVAEDQITLIRVPGAFEIPFAVQKAVNAGKFNAIICLGAIIRGGTMHYEFLASEVTKGISSIALKSDMPVVYGIITAENLEQAIDRAGGKEGNRGWEAAMSAIEMAGLNKTGI